METIPIRLISHYGWGLGCSFCCPGIIFLMLPVILPCIYYRGDTLWLLKKDCDCLRRIQLHKLVTRETYNSKIYWFNFDCINFPTMVVNYLQVTDWQLHKLWHHKLWRHNKLLTIEIYYYFAWNFTWNSTKSYMT